MQNKKIALFVCHDLVGLLMLNKVIPEMKAKGFSPVIFNTTTHLNRKFKTPAPSVVSTFNVRLLEKVIIPFLEKNNSKNLRHLSYKQLAQKYGAEYHEIKDINAPETLKMITDDPEIIGGMSLRFLQVFDAATIQAIGQKGFLWNLHSGLLGDYKGLLLPYRAIENGEKEYGVTLHEVSAGIDEGAIIEKAALPLDKTKPVMDLYMDTVDAAGGIVTKALDVIRQGLTPPAAPQSAEGRYYSNPTTEEFMAFAQKGIFYADPQATVQRISDAFILPGTPENKNLTDEIKAFIGLDPKTKLSPRKRA